MLLRHSQPKCAPFTGLVQLCIIPKMVFVAHTTKWVSVAQGFLKVGSGAGPYSRAPGNKPITSKEGQSLREQPPEARGMSVWVAWCDMLGLLGYRARQPQLITVSRDVTHQTRKVPLILWPAELCPIYWIGTMAQNRNNGICWPSHQTGKCGTRPFLRWVLMLSLSPDAPSIPKNASGHVGIPLKRCISGVRQAINLTPPSRVKAWGDSPLKLEVCPEDETHPTRSVALTSRPIEVCPINWIGTIAQNRNNSIWLTSHQPDECGTSPFEGGSGHRAVAQTRSAFPKMPRPRRHTLKKGARKLT